MNRDERIAWLEHASVQKVADATDDPILAAAMRLIDAFGWYDDPVLTPDTVLDIAEIVMADKIAG